MNEKIIIKNPIRKVWQSGGGKVISIPAEIADYTGEEVKIINVDMDKKTFTVKF